MHECKECGKKYEKVMSLARHFSQAHKMKAKDYYDKHLKKDGDDKCIVCGNLTKFLNVGKGYGKTCGHSCGAKEFRKDLKKDYVRFERFRKKVISNQSRIWLSGTEEERSARGLKGALATRKAGNKKYDWESIAYGQLRIAGVIPDSNRSYDEQAQELVNKNIAEIFGIGYYG